jgi:mRNA interferase RelE/StbE
LAWTIEFDASVEKELRKLGKPAQQRILKFLRELANKDDPRQSGKALRGKLTKLWRYRCGDYRIICQIQDNEIIIMVVKIGHRKDIYH